MEWGSLLRIEVWRCFRGQDMKSDTKLYEVNSATPLLENWVNGEQRRKRRKIFDLQRRRKAKKEKEENI